VQYLKWLNRVSPIGFKAIDTGFPGSLKFGLKWCDLGESWQRHRPVADLIGEALPITLLLECSSLPLIYFFALTTGIAAARARGKFVDVGLGTVLIALYSMRRRSGSAC